MKLFVTSFIFFASTLFARAALAVNNPSQQTPQAVSRDHERLAHFLTDSIKGDEGKVRAIFVWVTSHIRYDVKAFSNYRDKIYTPNQVLKRRKAVCQGYSDLLNAMCNDIGIKAQVIDGYGKSFEYDEGDQFFNPMHAWNAVEIDGEWKLIDATWSAGFLTQKRNKLKEFFASSFLFPFIRTKLKFVSRPNMTFYCMSPDSFVAEHASTDPLWQLLNPPLGVLQFESTFDSIELATKQRLAPAQASQAVNAYLSLSPLNKILTRCDRSIDFNSKNLRPYIDKEIAIGDSLFKQAFYLDGRAKDSILKVSTTHYAGALKWNYKVRVSISRDFQLMLKKNSLKKRMLFNENDSLHRINRTIVQRSNSGYYNFKGLRTQAKAYTKSMKHGLLPRTIPNIRTINAARRDKPEKLLLATLLNDSIVRCEMRATALKQMLQEIQIRQDSIERGLLSNFSLLVDNGYKQRSLLVIERNDRINMMDSYKAEVKALKNQVRALKDSMEVPAIAQIKLGCDSIKSGYRRMRFEWRNVLGIYRRNLQLIRHIRRIRIENTEIITAYNNEKDSLLNCVQLLLSASEKSAKTFHSLQGSNAGVWLCYERQNGQLSLQKAIEILRWVWARNHLYKKRSKELARTRIVQSVINRRINLIQKIKGAEHHKPSRLPMHGKGMDDFINALTK